MNINFDKGDRNLIQNIKIHNVATYTNLVEIKPKKLNFFMEAMEVEKQLFQN